MKRIGIILIVCLSWVFHAPAQSTHFSQFYASSVYLNPALAGIQSETKVTLNYRNHWPQIQNSFITKNVSFETPVKNSASNWGANVYQDQAGAGKMTVSSVSAVYAYDIQISNKVNMRMGFRPAYVSKSVNWNDLVFEDMIDANEGVTHQTSQSFGKPINYFDFASGAVIYSKTYFGGFSVDHINQPSAGLIGNSSVEKLKRRYTLHAGSKHEFNGNSGYYFSPNVLYSQQGEFTKLQLGAYLSTGAIQLGMWYSSQKSMVAMLGISAKKFRLAYSYDLYNSSNYGANLSSHELSYTHVLNGRAKKKKRYKRPPCPRF